MKRFNEYQSQIDESILAAMIIMSIGAAMVQDVVKWRKERKAETARLDAEIERNKQELKTEKWKAKAEKMRLKKEIQEERHQKREEKLRHMIAKFQILREQLAENMTAKQKEESDRLALAMNNTFNDEGTDEDTKIIDKFAKKKEKYSKEEIEKADKSIKAISDKDADEYIKKHLSKKSEKTEKELEKTEKEPEKTEKEPEKTEKKPEKTEKKPEKIEKKSEKTEKPKETIKKEKVINPETGKKETHAIHTGPRGGKYWISDKKNKIYVESLNESGIQELSRNEIILTRLAYLQWVMDNMDDDKDEKQINELQEIYNALYNMTYNTDGEVRALDDTISYIDQTMLNNKGIIPGLPDENQIEEIDEKSEDFKNLHPDEFDSYKKRIEQSNLDKTHKDKEDQADEILSPAETDSDKEALKKLSELTNIFGFTNIIGLESEKKPSDKDKKDKKDQKKDQKDDAMIQSKDSDENSKESKNEGLKSFRSLLESKYKSIL